MTCKSVLQHRTLYSIRQTVLIFCCIFFSATSYAQLRLQSLSTSTHRTTTSSSKKSGRIKTNTPLTLPFWDDFSNHSLDSLSKPTANKELWENSESVTINNSMAIDPPSIYVATFDGMDSIFSPYNSAQVLLNGVSDQMTSLPIDLTTVSAAGMDSVYLSFFYQWQGKGEAPDRNDYLLLEFLDSTASWIEIQSIYPGDTPDRTKFIFDSQHVDPKYRSANFQFRLTRYGRKSGPFDTWNVDYFYLNKLRVANDIRFPDRTFINEITPLFGGYRAMPNSHFKQYSKIDSLAYTYKSLSGKTEESRQAFFYANFNFIKYYSNGTKSNSKIKYNTYDLQEKIDPFIDSFDIVYRKFDTLSYYSDSKKAVSQNYFDSLAEKIIIEATFYIETNDNVDTTAFKRRFPFNREINDTLKTTFTLADYYAYDDSVAEYSTELANIGDMAALQFDIGSVTDTLIGADIYFPNLGISKNQSTTILVWDDVDGLPGNLLFKRSISVPQTSLNEFTRISFLNTIVSNKFYVGWLEKSNTDPTKVGFDESNDAGDKIFVNTQLAWTQNTLLHGSLMIRPVFGFDDTVTGITEEPPSIVNSLYPNPNEGTFIILGTYDKIDIMSITGQHIPFSEESTGDEGKKISLHTAPGLYLVQLQYKNRRETKKIIVK